MKNKRGLFAFFVAASAVVFLSQSACYYDVEETLYPGGGVCDTSQVRYSVEVTKILTDGSCLVCHSNAAVNGGITLEGYANLKKTVDDGTLIGSVRWSSGYNAMPKNAAQLTECELQKLEKWVADGAPNN